MMEAQISAWLLIIFCFELAIGAFLVFAARGTPWWKRLMVAPASLVMFVAGIALANNASNGTLDAFEAFDPKALAALFLVVNLFGFRLLRHLTQRENGYSIFGTIGRGLGCIASAWAAFALVILAIAGMMGLMVWLSN